MSSAREIEKLWIARLEQLDRGCRVDSRLRPSMLSPAEFADWCEVRLRRHFMCITHAEAMELTIWDWDRYYADVEGFIRDLERGLAV